MKCKSKLIFAGSIFLVILFGPASGYADRTTDKLAMSQYSPGAIARLNTLARRGVVIPTPTNYTSGLGEEIECWGSAIGDWCTCTGGNGSDDCDLLFKGCDAFGGLYVCDEDLGIPGDSCWCELWP